MVEFFGTVNEWPGVNTMARILYGADQFAHSPAREGDRVCRQGEDVYLASWVVLKTGRGYMALTKDHLCG